MDNVVELGVFASIILFVSGILNGIAEHLKWSMGLMIVITALGIIMALIGLFTGDEDVTAGSVVMFLISIAIIIISLAVCIPVMQNKTVFGLLIPNAIAATSFALLLAHYVEKVLGIPLGIIGLFMSD